MSHRYRRRLSISTAPQSQDGAGNAANLSLTGLTQTGPQIDTTTPVISSIAESPSSGDLNAGKTVTYTIDMSENVTVSTAGGTPTWRSTTVAPPPTPAAPAPAH